jgi:hypothetical protein
MDDVCLYFYVEDREGVESVRSAHLMCEILQNIRFNLHGNVFGFCQISTRLYSSILLHFNKLLHIRL